jgi:hypothetical protein
VLGVGVGVEMERLSSDGRVALEVAAAAAGVAKVASVMKLFANPWTVRRRMVFNCRGIYWKWMHYIFHDVDDYSSTHDIMTVVCSDTFPVMVSADDSSCH